MSKAWSAGLEYGTLTASQRTGYGRLEAHTRTHGVKTLGGISGSLPSLPDLAADAEQLVKAEKAMWAWYLEWSRIARKVISQRSLLRQLGVLRSTSSGGEEVEIDDEDQNETGADNGSDTPETPGADSGSSPDATKAKKTKQPT